MKNLISPILIIGVGIAWLLNVMGIVPGVDWLWTASIAAVGIAILAFGGINRLTVILCPLLITASIFSVLRQTGRLSIDEEVPLLTIALGIYWLIAVALKVPLPKICESEPDTTQNKTPHVP